MRVLLSSQVIGEEEDVSVYDLADHPDFHFRTTDIVIRIGNSDTEQNMAGENEVKSLVFEERKIILKCFVC